MNIMNERWRKLNANMHQYVPFRANMGQHCSLSAVQRKTAFLEQSWWPEFDMFGSMPWWSFAWHKLLLRLTPKNCYKVYSLNLIDEFTSLFSPKVIAAGLPRESFPHAFVDMSVLRTKILPRLAQGLFSNERTCWNHWSYCPNEYNEWKVEKAECQHAPMCAIPCQHGPTLHFVSCAEKDRLSGTVMMVWIWHVWINAMVFVPMAQAPLEADANELLKSTVQSKFDRWVYTLFLPKVIVAGLPRESFPHAFVDISVIVWLCTRILPRLAQGLFSNE